MSQLFGILGDVAKGFGALIAKGFGTICAALIIFLVWWLWNELGKDVALLCLAGVAVAGVIIFLIILFYRYIQIRQAELMEGELAAQASDRHLKREQVKAAVESIQDKWNEAMITLRTGRVRIYELPWVLLIGEPQSGKTTTLQESGLDFPLGKNAFSGSGGTVNCDWWFANEAVIIDTAGRFTLPVDSAPDREEWRAFLGLLAKYRPKRPINSVIVTIPATSLLEDDAAEITDKAQKIRDKLTELTTLLGVEFPVYMMVSKLDLVYGFAEFCASLSASERQQIVGWNTESFDNRPFDPAEFASAFDDLTARFNRWALRRLRELPPGNEADRVLSFPRELAQIKDALSLYMGTIFKPDRFNMPLFIRGCYFSSGIQEGKAIRKALTGEQGTGENGLRKFEQFFVQSRPYFIHTFYKKVFRERGLVRQTQAKVQKETRLRIAAVATACLLTIISSWYLFSGYRFLTESLKPLNRYAKEAHDIIDADTPGPPTKKAGDIGSLVTSIQNGRKLLESDSVKRRFLRSGNYSILTDLKHIEDALLMKGVFRPLFKKAGEEMAKSALATSMKKDAFVRAMQQYVAMMTAVPDDSQPSASIDPVLSAFPLQNDPWLNMDRKELIELWKTYPRSGKRVAVFPDSDEALAYYEGGLQKLLAFWETFPVNQWQNTIDKLDSITRAYDEIIDIPVDVYRKDKLMSFPKYVETFKKNLTLLHGNGITRFLVTPDHLAEACKDSFRQISEFFPADRKEDLKLLIVRKQNVCLALGQNVASNWRDKLRQYRHMLHEDGTLSPDINFVMEGLIAAMDFKPRMSKGNRDYLKEDPESIPATIRRLGTEWQEKRTVQAKTIEEMLSSVNEKGWEKQHLLAVVGMYLDHVLWQADSGAVYTAKRILLENDVLDAEALSPGMDPPRMARAAWLMSRCKIMAEISDNLKEKYREHSERRKVTNEVRLVMLKAYRSYLKFWNNTLEAIQPDHEIRDVNSWSRFKDQVIQVRGMFIDPLGWPLNVFLENISLDNFLFFEELFGEEVKTDIRYLEQRLKIPAIVYGGKSKLLPQLITAQEKFYESMQALSEDASTAWNTLKQDKAMAGFKSFSSFRDRVRRIEAGSEEPLSVRLVEIERLGERLLNEAVNEDLRRLRRSFANKLSKFMSIWYPKLGSRYPFMNHEDPDFRGDDRKYIAEKITTVSAIEMHDFCFKPSSGMGSLMKEFNIIPRLENKADPLMDRWQRDLLSSCLAWRKFLFTDDGQPKVHKVTVTLDAEGTYAARQFTKLDISGLSEAGNRNKISLRFSGSHKQKDAEWHISGATPEVIVTAINEETRRSTKEPIIGGDLVLPEYLMSKRINTNHRGRNEWVVEIRLPDINKETKRKVPVKIRFRWDEDLPARIQWPESRVKRP